MASRQPPAAVSIALPADDPLLDHFLHAALRGDRVWAWCEPAQVKVDVAPPPSGTAADTQVLFVRALREAMGRAASSAAERELAATADKDGGLAAAVVRRVIEAAEAERSLLMGASYGLRMRHSALLGGAGFRAICHDLGVDPDSLPAERRMAIDDAIAAEFSAQPTADAARLRGWLVALLQQRLH